MPDEELEPSGSGWKERASRVKDHARKLGVIATTAAVAWAGIAKAQPASAEGLNQPELRSIESLPGYGKKTTPEQARHLKDSTVKIYEVQEKNGQVIWEGEICTGVKVAIGGKSYVLTANHCFNNIFNKPEGTFSGIINSPAKNSPDFYDFQKVSKNNRNYFNFLIVDPHLSLHNGRDSMPIAKVTGLNMNVKGLDYSLLKTEPINAFTATGSSSQLKVPVPRSWDAIPSLPYKSATTTPALGQEATLFSVPDPYGNNPGNGVSAKGTYIGRIQEYDTTSSTYKMLDVVALNVPTQGEDPAHERASGSTAVLADGRMLGPLSASYNIGFGPKRTNRDNTNYPLDSIIGAWHNVEYSTGVKIPQNRYNTLALYQSVDPNTVRTSANSFGKYISQEAMFSLDRH